MSATNPAWQGAVHVARARLQTIDEALAKLEAIVPDVDDPSSSSKDQSPDQSDAPSSQKAPEDKSDHQLETKLKNAKIEPTPIPHSSLQALEIFIKDTYQKRYVPQAV